jgi:hypothetical protein
VRQPQHAKVLTTPWLRNANHVEELIETRADYGVSSTGTPNPQPSALTLLLCNAAGKSGANLSPPRHFGDTLIEDSSAQDVIKGDSRHGVKVPFEPGRWTKLRKQVLVIQRSPTLKKMRKLIQTARLPNACGTQTLA